jgi:integrase/recombinase XerC
MLPQFLEYLHQRGYSKLTIQSYDKSLRQYFSEMILLSETKHTLASWSKAQVSPAPTFNRQLAAIKSYYKFLQKFGYIKDNPAQSIAFRKKKKRLPNFNPAPEAIPDNIPLIHKAVLTLLSETGIRLAELLSIKACNIGERSIKVLGKGNKERIVPLSRHCSALLSEIKTQDQTLLFGLSRTQVQYITRKYQHCNPHTLRHNFATTLINAGASLLSIKELLGHSSIAATQVYTHVNYEHLKKVHEKCHPKP